MTKRIFTLRGLYAISDAGLMPEKTFLAQAEQALCGGAKIFQYRDKSQNHALRLAQAQGLKRLCVRYGAACIINDDIELAAAIDADGVHLGREDDAFAAARARLGSDAIIGVSCYNEWERAVAAQQAGADYIAFGRFFLSQTKPNAVPADPALLTRAKAELALPVAAIGGITADNASPLVQAGADMLAVIQGLFSHADIAKQAAALSDLYAIPANEPAPLVQQLAHVALLVEDLDKVQTFYQQLLGFRLSEQRPASMRSPGVWLDINPQQQLHLLQLPGAQPQANHQQHGGRDRHSAVRVTDLALLQSRLELAQWPYTRSESGREAIFCRDPEGNAWEFMPQ